MIRGAYEALGMRPARYRPSLPGPGGEYVADPRSGDASPPCSRPGSPPPRWWSFRSPRLKCARIVPCQVVIGAKEAADGRVAPRLRDGRRVDALPAGEVVARVGALVAAHRAELRDEEPPPS